MLSWLIYQSNIFHYVVVRTMPYSVTHLAYYNDAKDVYYYVISSFILIQFCWLALYFSSPRKQVVWTASLAYPQTH